MAGELPLMNLATAKERNEQYVGRTVNNTPIITNTQSADDYWRDSSLQELIANTGHNLGLDAEGIRALQYSVFAEGMFNSTSQISGMPGGIARRRRDLEYDSNSNESYNNALRSQYSDKSQLYDNTLSGLYSFADEWAKGTYDKNGLSKDDIREIDNAISKGFRWKAWEGNGDKTYTGFSLPFNTMLKAMAVDIKYRAKKIDDIVKAYDLNTDEVRKSDLIRASYVGGLKKIRSWIGSGKIKDAIDKYVVKPSGLKSVSESEGDNVSDSTAFIEDIEFPVQNIRRVDYSSFTPDSNGILKHTPIQERQTIGKQLSKDEKLKNEIIDKVRKYYVTENLIDEDDEEEFKTASEKALEFYDKNILSLDSVLKRLNKE